MISRYAITCLCFILLLNFGCNHSNEGRNVITIAAGGTARELQYLDEDLKSFEIKHPGIKTRLIKLPSSSSQQHDVFVTYLSSRDTTIDIYNLDIIWVSEFAAAGWLIPLDRLWAEQDRGDFIQGSLNGCSYQGQYYGVPWFSSCGLLYYRKDILDKYSIRVPQSFQELETAIKTVQSQEPDWTGFVWQGAQYEGLICNYYEVLWAAGSEENALSRMARTLSVRLSPSSVLSFKEEDVRQFFSDGKVLFMRNWPYAWTYFSDEKNPLYRKVGISSLPWGDKPQESASCLGGWNLAISRYSTHSDLAWELVQFLTAPEQMMKKSRMSGELPARISLLRNPELQEQHPYWDVIAEILRGARARPQTAFYSDWSEMLQLEVSKFLVGGTPIHQTRQKMIDTWNKIQVLEKKPHEKNS